MEKKQNSGFWVVKILLDRSMLIIKGLSPLLPFYTLLCYADTWILQSTSSFVSCLC